MNQNGSSEVTLQDLTVFSFQILIRLDLLKRPPGVEKGAQGGERQADEQVMEDGQVTGGTPADTHWRTDAHEFDAPCSVLPQCQGLRSGHYEVSYAEVLPRRCLQHQRPLQRRHDGKLQQARSAEGDGD